MPRLVLLHYGDHPVIEPGELYLRVILGQDGATRDAWMQEHFDRLEGFRAQRLPEVKGFMVTTDVPDSAGRRPTRIMKMDGISLLDAEEDELASANGRPTRGSANGHESWTSSKPGSDPCRPIQHRCHKQHIRIRPACRLASAIGAAASHGNRNGVGRLAWAPYLSRFGVAAGRRADALGVVTVTRCAPEPRTHERSHQGNPAAVLPHEGPREPYGPVSKPAGLPR